MTRFFLSKCRYFYNYSKLTVLNWLCTGNLVNFWAPVLNTLADPYNDDEQKNKGHMVINIPNGR